MIEFEVVLANGTVVETNVNSHPDLFWSLKGSGNNFGIVTSVILEVFQHPPKWYTFQRFDMDSLPIVFDRMEKRSKGMPVDVWHVATTLQWHVPTQEYVVSERMVASKLPHLQEKFSAVTEDGQVLESSVLQTNSYEKTIFEMAQKMQGMNENGLFNFFGSVTVESDARLLLAFANIFQEEVEVIKTESDLGINIVYNPITLNTLRHMKQKGGNALGLKEEDGPLTGMCDSNRRLQVSKISQW